MFAWQFTTALYLADLHGWTRALSPSADSLQPALQGEEREIIPPAAKPRRRPSSRGPPFARGRLARPCKRKLPNDLRPTSSENPCTRLPKKSIAKSWTAWGESPSGAESRALRRRWAWLLGKPGITSPIVGATKPNHLSEAAAALSLRLTPDEISFLEEPYVPHAVLGHK